MREHPEYKYRPRRKPKPLVKKDGTSKYGFPLPFFPPGIDPMLAARSFAFSPHYAAALAAATAYGAHSSPVNSILPGSEIINPFSTLPIPSSHVPSTIPSTTTSLNSQEGFLKFMQKYHEEQNSYLATSRNSSNPSLHSASSKARENYGINKEQLAEKTNVDMKDMEDELENDEDEESLADESEDDEVLDVDGNEITIDPNHQISSAKKLDNSTTKKLTAGKEHSSL